MKLLRFAFWSALAFGLSANLVFADPMPKADWQAFTSERGGYRIELPGKAQENVTDLPSAPGEKMYVTGLRYGSGSLMAIASDVADYKEADKVLDFGRDTAVKAMGGAILKETKETVGKYPARRFDYSANQYSGTMRLILVDKRLYQINAIGPAGFSASLEAKRFLDSFALTEK